MELVFDFLLGPIGKYLAMGAGLVAAALGLRWSGARSANQKHKIKELEEHVETSRDISDAQADAAGTDADSWLSDRVKDRDL